MIAWNLPTPLTILRPGKKGARNIVTGMFVNHISRTGKAPVSHVGFEP